MSRKITLLLKMDWEKLGGFSQPLSSPRNRGPLVFQFTRNHFYDIEIACLENRE